MEIDRVKNGFIKPLRTLKKHQVEIIPNDLGGYIALQTTKGTQETQN